MTAQGKRAKPGDVMLVRTRNGVAYLHYVGRHSKYGDAVVVSRRLAAPQRVTDQMFSNRYLTFYPAAAAVAQGLVEVVDHLPPPELPQILRRAGKRTGPHVDTWIIEDSNGQVVRSTLSDEELELPIAAIWNHEMLIHRIDEGWTPAPAGRSSASRETQALVEVVAPLHTDMPRIILHYVYVPSSQVATSTAAELRGHGFHTEERLVADGVVPRFLWP